MPEIRFCTFCGRLIAQPGPFCGGCGRRLRSADSTVVSGQSEGPALSSGGPATPGSQGSQKEPSIASAASPSPPTAATPAARSPAKATDPESPLYHEPSPQPGQPIPAEPAASRPPSFTQPSDIINAVPAGGAGPISGAVLILAGLLLVASAALAVFLGRAGSGSSSAPRPGVAPALSATSPDTGPADTARPNNPAPSGQTDGGLASGQGQPELAYPCQFSDGMPQSCTSKAATVAVQYPAFESYACPPKVTVDWGDRTPPTDPAGAGLGYQHTYLAPGTYKIVATATRSPDYSPTGHDTSCSGSSTAISEFTLE
jgi:hypothetical protein